MRSSVFTDSVTRSSLTQSLPLQQREGGGNSVYQAIVCAFGKPTSTANVRLWVSLLVKLLPFSFQEACKADQALTPDTFMLQGGYPRIYDTRMPLNLFFSNYIDTYIERDVSEYLDVRNLAEFRRFLTLCALSSGALINYTNIANELGVSPRTVKAWMSILESSYIAFHLIPFYTNARKQVVKTPKLYFYDTGLLCHLLGIRTVEALVAHPKFGDIFENLIIAETMKQHLNANQEPQLFFYRDASKVEVDLLDFTDPNNRMLIEIKSGQTYHDRFARHLTLIGNVLGIPCEQQYVTSRVEHSYVSQGIRVTSTPRLARRPTVKSRRRAVGILCNQ